LESAPTGFGQCNLKETLGRPRRRWENNIKTELNKLGCAEDVNWINLAQDRDKGRAAMTAVMDLRGSIPCGELLGLAQNRQLLKTGSPIHFPSF